jgi:hypothetical protein
MATTTNYGWETPDDTDLVKDGAAAIRTLGSAIDTTMATMVPKSLVDAKGDLFTATADNTPARLAVGTNGYTLVADSVEATGLKWAAPASATFTSFTPTWTNVTVGNSVESFSYALTGKIAMVQGAIKLGSTGSVTGALRMDVPFAYTMPTNSDFYLVIGKWTAVDASTSLSYTGSIVPSNGELRFYPDAPNTVAGQTTTIANALSNAVPFTWAVNDIFTIQYFIRAT